MTIILPPANTSNLSELLSKRGWHRNTEITTLDCTVWDFEPSLPEQFADDQDVSPTCLFIYDVDELGFCGVEPATRTTEWNPLSMTFDRLEDFLPWLPAIEHWRATEPCEPPSHHI
ncbi:hypothetical protein SAMN04489740_4339 [Arthrobacter alpinus]|uniref:Uncharacterized protein n=1 Tax=Arthrobacter alpinus TaxID=656366 RepID=A0A1H5PGZ1_9MICC|nr:hypothetical protein [Arthrobacter alpinus]SEF13159.1 hypothetical protein SAMN04489740_4339 [Arthrobacter alpinus]